MNNPKQEAFVEATATRGGWVNLWAYSSGVDKGYGVWPSADKAQNMAMQYLSEYHPANVPYVATIPLDEL